MPKKYVKDPKTSLHGKTMKQIIKKMLDAPRIENSEINKKFNRKQS